MTLKQIKNHIKVFTMCHVKTPGSINGLALFSITTVLISLAYNLYAGTIIDNALSVVSTKGSFSQMILPLAIFMSLLIGMSLSESIKNFFEVIYNNSIALILDDYKYTKNITLDTQTYIDPTFTAKKQILEENGWKVTAIPKTVIEFISSLLPVLLYLTVLFSYNWRIGLLASLSSLPVLYVKILSGKRIWNIWDDNSNIKVTWNMYRNSLWGDITDIKILGAGKFIVDKMLFYYREFLAKINDNEKKLLLNIFGATTFEYILLIAAYIILFQGIIVGTYTVGAFIVITASLWGVKRELGTTLERYSVFESDANFVDDFVEYMETKSKIISNEDAVVIAKLEPISVEFRNVWFKYPRTKKWIFRGLNFKITKDEDVAIVGKNGAGKTTMVKLITRMYDPIKGQILINDIPLTDINLEEYYKIIGILSQDFRIFEFSAKENIQIGNITKKSNLTNIKQSAILAQADSIIEDLKKGYDTCLTSKVEDGQDLSGGQRQRVAIARIFYREPKLLIMDEPTSAIDALAEEEIFNSIFAFAEKRTVIIISHRFATIKRAHRIIVIDKGEIIEDGTHSELLEKDGLYKRMYLAQE